MRNNIINKLKYCLNKKKDITISYIEAMYLLDILKGNYDKE